MDGDRHKGRPPRRWVDDIMDWCGHPLPEVVRLCDGRQRRVEKGRHWPQRLTRAISWEEESSTGRKSRFFYRNYLCSTPRAGRDPRRNFANRMLALLILRTLHDVICRFLVLFLLLLYIVAYCAFLSFAGIWRSDCWKTRIMGPSDDEINYTMRRFH